MSVKFEVEGVHVIKEKAYLFVRLLNKDDFFIITEASSINEVPIEKWVEVPRALDKEGNPRLDFFSFALRNILEKDKFKIGQVVTLTDEYVEVIDVFDLIMIGMLVSLRCPAGKLELPVTIADFIVGKTWNVKKRPFMTGSIQSYEMIEREERENIFQYLLEPINHEDTPEVGSKLKIFPS